MDTRSVLEDILPVEVDSFEIESEAFLLLHAGAISLNMGGPFVGQSNGEAIWDTMPKEILLQRLQTFIGQRLYAVEGGRGWIHLDFTNGWIRLVAESKEWEAWTMWLPGVAWDGWWDSDALGSSRVVGRKVSPKASLRKPSA